MSTERTIDATKVNPSATAEGDVFVMLSAGGSLKKCDIDAITARLKELGVVSGRNIVKDSHPDKETTEYLVAQHEYTEELAVGDIITITLFGELGSQKEKFTSIHNGGDGTRGTAHMSKIADGIYRGTLTVRATDGDGTLHIYAAPNSVTSSSKVRCVMVERGKTGSLMWTPAPEDVADLLAKSGGGVKSTLPIYYTSHPQSAEKGVRHERQNNADDRIHTAFTPAERACRQVAVDFRYGRPHSSCRNLPGITINAESTRRGVSVRPRRDCRLLMGRKQIRQTNIRFRQWRIPVPSVLGRFNRLESLVRNRNLENRHVNIARRKEVVAA